MYRKLFLSFVLIISSFCSLIAQSQRELIYKEIGTVKLKMVIYTPEQMTASDTLPAMIFFFGGGWETGNIIQFQYYAENYAKKGLITILADYRISSVHGTTPFESLKDAKSAVRYLKQHAKDLQIDTTRLIASGGSAGGHLAAACFTNETIDEDTDPMEYTSKPKVLVLFNPVVDNSVNGYGYDRLGDRWEEFSPLHNVRSPFPPTIFFLGTKDNIIPVATGQLFKQEVEAIGGRCDLKLYESVGHGFFNQAEYRDRVILDVDTFLQSVNCLAQDERIPQTITFPLITARYVGDEDFDPRATASSGLPVEYTSGDTNVAVVSDGKIRIMGKGSTVITARQSGNDKFCPAAAVLRILVVLDQDDVSENYWLDINFTRDSTMWKNAFPPMTMNGLNLQSAPSGDYIGYSCTGAFGKFAVSGYSYTPYNSDNLNEQFIYAFRLGTGSSSHWTFPVIPDAGAIRMHLLCGNSATDGEFVLQKSMGDNQWEDFNPVIKIVAPANGLSTRTFPIEKELNLEGPVQLRVKGPATKNVHIYAITISKNTTTRLLGTKDKDLRFCLSERKLSIQAEKNVFNSFIYSSSGIFKGSLRDGEVFSFDNAGVYVIKVITSGGITTQKIIVV
mgnify:FL=1